MHCASIDKERRVSYSSEADSAVLAGTPGHPLDSGRVRSAQDVGHLADDMDGVEVMRVTGATTARKKGVRRAVASLHLDPAIRADVQAQEGMVGVSLMVKPYLADALECTLARVAPGHTDVWSPSRIQRMPGEGGCDVGNAIHPMPPPH